MGYSFYSGLSHQRDARNPLSLYQQLTAVDPDIMTRTVIIDPFKAKDTAIIARLALSCHAWFVERNVSVKISDGENGTRGP